MPGFLGGAEHFGNLPTLLNAECRMLSWHDFADTSDLKAAAQQLIKLAGNERPHLVGYSMGGRLTLHTALAAPQTFTSITVLSAHPGIESSSERLTRKQRDSEWAQRLREELWPSFWAAWNAQPALQQTTPVERSEPTASEKQLWATLLERMGTGTQDFLTPALAQATTPMLYICGEYELPAHLPLLPKNLITTFIPEAGHRTPLDAPEALADILKDFFQQTEKVIS